MSAPQFPHASSGQRPDAAADADHRIPPHRSPQSPGAATGDPLNRGNFRTETPAHTPNTEGDEPLTPLPPEASRGLSLLAQGPPRQPPGRPRQIDQVARGQIAALLAVGLSMRHVAAFLGVSAAAICETIAADPELAQQIHAAKVRAELVPFQTIFRESRRSWRAAVWMLANMRSQTEQDRQPMERVHEGAQEAAVSQLQEWIGHEMAHQEMTRRQHEQIYRKMNGGRAPQ